MGGETHSRASTPVYPKLASHPVGKQITNIFKDRLRQFTDGGQYWGQGLMAKMDEGRVSGGDHVKLQVYSPPDLARPTFKEATSSKFKPTNKGESFGPSWSTHWFRITLKIPPELQEKKHLEFHWDAGNEGLIWNESGTPIQGLTGGDRVEWILPKEWRDGKAHTFFIEMACNGMFGNAPGGDIIQPPDPNKYFRLNTADIVAVNLEARALHVDFWIIGDAAREFPGDCWESHEALQVCNNIMDAFIDGNGSQESILDGRAIARQYIGNVDSADVYESGKQPIVFAIGHCHIDTCWLWPWAETKRKVARSWANQCDLMDRYPEHRFTCSQAQQYKWLEQYYPSLFDRVKTKVKQGTFLPIGGSWVEHDTNMPSGESLTRQFLYGQRFFESHFGERCQTFWLPDTFGYSSQLPQLCRLAGMSRFFTQKLSWNNINNFPHTTFNWVSLDGSQVICHMAPSETYTADAHFGDVRRSVLQHKSMDQDNTSLLVFGKGDGGGGPTFQHIEKLRRCRGMSDKTGLLPRVKMGDSVDDFFARLEKRAANGTEFVTWYGELYFELHRGTYTTQAKNKYNNRKTEVLMHDIELLATLATLKKKSYKYPKKDIDDMWEGILLCQFHDCLPGSSIEMCYDDSDELYAGVYQKGKKIFEDALAALGYCEYQKNSVTPVALNTLPWDRAEIVRTETSDTFYALAQGGSGISNLRDLTITSMPKRGLSAYMFFANEQRENVREENPDILFGQVGKILGDRWNTLNSSQRKPYEELAKADQERYDAEKASFQAGNQAGGYVSMKESKSKVFVLANDDLELTIQKGEILSLWDKKANRQVLQEGKKANQFVLFDDKPLYWQAWDVEVFHLNSRKELPQGETKISEINPHRASVVTEAKISENSWIKTTISLTASINGEPSRVEIESEVEWHEKMKFLKVEFPVNIVNTEASYETQYGIVKRPTHYNTSWDMAKFEVCCHKWADLSEHGYGVSILNDCKYGFATCGSLMRLSLLRSPKAPDAHADMGRHKIRYAIFPHAGPLDHRTVRAAYNFNHPFRLVAATDALTAAEPSPFSAISLRGSPSLILDAVKRGEDDEDVSRGDLPVRKGRSVVLRIYDSLGGSSRGTITWDKKLVPVKKVFKTNLLEDDLHELEIGTDGKSAAVGLRPFEVATFRLQL